MKLANCFCNNTFVAQADGLSKGNWTTFTTTFELLSHPAYRLVVVYKPLFVHTKMLEFATKHLSRFAKIAVQGGKGNAVLLANGKFVGVVNVHLGDESTITFGGKLQCVRYAVVKTQTVVASFGVVTYRLHLSHCAISPICH